jgi:hypothetical protein
MWSRLRNTCSNVYTYNNVTSALGLAITGAIALTGTLTTRFYANAAAQTCASYAKFLSSDFRSVTFAQHDLAYPITVSAQDAAGGDILKFFFGENAFNLLVNFTTPMGTLADVSDFTLGESTTTTLETTLPTVPAIAASICSGVVTMNGAALTIAVSGIALTLTAAYIMNNRLRNELKDRNTQISELEAVIANTPQRLC